MDGVTLQGKAPLDVVALFPQLADVTNSALRDAAIAVWQELWAMSPWTDIHDVPTSASIPYPTVPHNQAVLTMALAVADAFAAYHRVTLDRDRLIVAAVLQDASKIVEFARDASGKVAPTERGRHFPHAFWAAHVALQHGIPDEIVNIILTHTPHSPKFPDSLEGKILYYVDQIDVLGIHGDRWRKDISITK